MFLCAGSGVMIGQHHAVQRGDPGSRLLGVLLAAILEGDGHAGYAGELAVHDGEAAHGGGVVIQIGNQIVIDLDRADGRAAQNSQD